jgi:acyl-coenzyme A thioesterase PaaI-like protein
MLMTFADMQLGLGARFDAEEDVGFMPTVNLTADFLAPARARGLGRRPHGSPALDAELSCSASAS